MPIRGRPGKLGADRLAARRPTQLDFRGFVGSFRQHTAILPNPHTLRHPDWGALSLANGVGPGGNVEVQPRNTIRKSLHERRLCF